MKVILSRKGFDSSSGGVPSPILPDGRMVSLPIPAKAAPKKYSEISWAPGQTMGDIVRDLAPARVKPTHFAHLDPDLNATALARPHDWRAVFGQLGSSQAHLANAGVKGDDLFLFFGLFRLTEHRNGRLAYVKGTKPMHVLFGWLQVDSVLRVDEHRENIPWAADHPHLHMPRDPVNTVYVARRELHIPGLNVALPGAGLFDLFSPDLRLTACDSTARDWLLPGWFEPAESRPPLTFHGSQDRWTREGDHVRLRTVGRGQEFVLDTAFYPECSAWLERLLRDRG